MSSLTLTWCSLWPLPLCFLGTEPDSHLAAPSCQLGGIRSPQSPPKAAGIISRAAPVAPTLSTKALHPWMQSCSHRVLSTAAGPPLFIPSELQRLSRTLQHEGTAVSTAQEEDKQITTATRQRDRQHSPSAKPPRAFGRDK